MPAGHGSSRCKFDYIARVQFPRQPDQRASHQRCGHHEASVGANYRHQSCDCLRAAGSVTLAPRAVQAFTATVWALANQAVVWQVQGSGCASAGACGSVTPTEFTPRQMLRHAKRAAVVAVTPTNIAIRPSPSRFRPAEYSIAALPQVSTRWNGGLHVARDGTACRIEAWSRLAADRRTARTTTCNSTLECTAP